VILVTIIVTEKTPKCNPIGDFFAKFLLAA
jgi:hypothetical protein